MNATLQAALSELFLDLIAAIVLSGHTLDILKFLHSVAAPPAPCAAKKIAEAARFQQF